MKYAFYLLLLLVIITAGCAVFPRHGYDGNGEVYEGSGQGYRGSIHVQVRLNRGSITEIVVDSIEDRFVGKAAMEELIDTVIGYNSTDVDVISGATVTSKGFLEAVENAIIKTGKRIMALNSENEEGTMNCIFCKIIAGEIPSRKLYEDDEILAFYDINSMAPVHFLVIPKKHITNLFELEIEDTALAGRLLYKAQELAKQQGCEEKGGRLIINTKSDGGQTVDHLHIHFMGGRALGWPPG